MKTQGSEYGMARIWETVCMGQNTEKSMGKNLENNMGHTLGNKSAINWGTRMEHHIENKMRNHMGSSIVIIDSLLEPSLQHTKLLNR